MLTLTGGALVLASCGEDPALKYRREAQTRQIVDLEARLARMNAVMREDLKETAKDVEESKRMADETEEFLKAKEEELAGLETAVAKAEKDHEAYRRRYVVKDLKAGGKP